MEINIPYLQDLEFEDSCLCTLLGPLDPDCPVCKGVGSTPTVVGERLLAFLKARGMVPPK